MAVLSNSRHERFAQELAAGKTGDEAYQIAGYTANRHNASRLKTNETVLARVAELQGRAAISAEVTLESLIIEAADIQAKALKAEQFAPAVSALTAKAKLAGLWVEKSERTNRNVDADSLTDAEIVERLRAIGGSPVAGLAAPPINPSQLN